MASSPPHDRLVVDPIHGDIHLTPPEWGVVNTGPFQRLRHIKQIGMGHFTYPNATHTRFAHSLGVLGIMGRVLEAAEGQPGLLGDVSPGDLRLAALLHDIGHYPYSHVMETLGSVILTEDWVEPRGGAKKPLDLSSDPYPSHEAVGRMIVGSQPELLEAIGGETKAQAIADLFTRSRAANPQMSKLIHSSLDMDRLDYLLRDARAAGVPYGEIDVNYILNSFGVSGGGLIGVSRKALPAAEQFLLARYFMYRAVYYHKTTVALEEACRQLLRRLRDRGESDVPRDAGGIKEIVTTDRLGKFTDAFVDSAVQDSLTHADETIKALAACIHRRRPPRLLKEVCALVSPTRIDPHVQAFGLNCRLRLNDLAQRRGIALGRFLFWEGKPIKFEERGASVTAAQAQQLPSEQEEEAIKVFADDGGEPQAIMDVDYSIMQLCAGHLFRIVRLYLAWPEDSSPPLDDLRGDVRDWDH